MFSGWFLGHGRLTKGRESVHTVSVWARKSQEGLVVVGQGYGACGTGVELEAFGCQFTGL